MLSTSEMESDLISSSMSLGKFKIGNSLTLTLKKFKFYRFGNLDRERFIILLSVTYSKLIFLTCGIFNIGN